MAFADIFLDEDLADLVQMKSEVRWLLWSLAFWRGKVSIVPGQPPKRIRCRDRAGVRFGLPVLRSLFVLSQLTAQTRFSHGGAKSQVL
jgi:hypothetical protein